MKPDRLEHLETLRTGDGRPLPERLKGEIRRQVQRLALVLERVAALEAERDAVLKAPAGEAPEPAGPAGRKIRALARLKGIGPEIATVLHTEVLYRQFAHRRDVAA